MDADMLMRTNLDNVFGNEVPAGVIDGRGIVGDVLDRMTRVPQHAKLKMVIWICKGSLARAVAIRSSGAARGVR